MSLSIDGTADAVLDTIAPVSEARLSNDPSWPPLMSSEPIPEPRLWSVVPESQQEDILEVLRKNCHDARSLTAAGYNVELPSIPSLPQMEAKVKCKNCRKSRYYVDYTMEKTGQVDPCPSGRATHHIFGGVTHLIARYTDFRKAPKQSPGKPKRRAIALDCEMAGGWNGDGFVEQLIQLTAVDYLSGEILISTLVAPTMDIRQWRSSIHGIKRGMMAEALANGTALVGSRQARAALFELMDNNTILVGHALHNDLNVLKIAHGRCVDSLVLAITAISRPGNKQAGLKKLCDDLLGLSVQRASTHSCLEDSFAAREVVLHMTNYPEALAVWAKVQQEKLDAEEVKRVSETEAKARREESSASPTATRSDPPSGPPAKKAKTGAIVNDQYRGVPFKGQMAPAGMNVQGSSVISSDRMSQAGINGQTLSVPSSNKMSEAGVNAVRTPQLPVLLPTPAHEIPVEMQMDRGPSVGKRRKGGEWEKFARNV